MLMSRIKFQSYTYNRLSEFIFLDIQESRTNKKILSQALLSADMEIANPGLAFLYSL